MANRFEFVNANGDTFDFRAAGVGLSNITGLGELQTEIRSVESPLLDGARFLNTRQRPRVIAGDVTVFEEAETLDVIRREFMDILTPFALGVLIVQIKSGPVYLIDALVQRRALDKRNPTYCAGAVQWWCPDPYFRSDSENEQLVIVGEGGLAVPIIVPAEISETAGITTVTNEGNVESYPTTVISGECESPSIENQTTGELLSFAGLEMGAGDELEINHLRGTATLNDESVTSYLTNSSAFWVLRPGDNVIRLEATSGSPQASIRYYDRFSGI